MKPGTLVAYISGAAYLGRIVQPILFGGDRRWTVEWLDGFVDRDVNTYSESNLIRVVPQ